MAQWLRIKSIGFSSRGPNPGSIQSTHKAITPGSDPLTQKNMQEKTQMHIKINFILRLKKSLETVRRKDQVNNKVKLIISTLKLPGCVKNGRSLCMLILGSLLVRMKKKWRLSRSTIFNKLTNKALYTNTYHALKRDTKTAGS